MIGLSTGGPYGVGATAAEAAGELSCSVLIVQHMPKLFTGALAERLDKSCALRVKEAYENAIIRPGTIWLAPGDAHMEVGPSNGLTDKQEGALAGEE